MCERHIPAPRITPPLGSPLPTCLKCGKVYMPDDDDEPVVGDTSTPPGATTMIRCFADLPIETAVTRVAIDRFAWPGGYALGLLMSDSEPVCSYCVSTNVNLIMEALHSNDRRSSWFPLCAYYCDEDDDLTDDDHFPTLCSHCNRPISDATTPTPKE